MKRAPFEGGHPHVCVAAVGLRCFGASGALTIQLFWPPCGGDHSTGGPSQTPLPHLLLDPPPTSLPLPRACASTALAEARRRRVTARFYTPIFVLPNPQSHESEPRAEWQRGAGACPVRPVSAHHRVALWSVAPLDVIRGHGSCGRTRAFRHVRAHAHGRGLGTATPGGTVVFVWDRGRCVRDRGRGGGRPLGTCVAQRCPP